MKVLQATIGTVALVTGLALAPAHAAEEHVALLLLGLVPAAAAARSNAADYLIAEQITACHGNPGEMAPTAVTEQDLTGDGRPDLILSHEGAKCSGSGSPAAPSAGRSS